MDAADVIVIGSGPSGVSVSFPLIAAGLRVLMIDAGCRPLALAPDLPPLRRMAGSRDYRRLTLGDGLEGLVGGRQMSPKLKAPASRAAFAGFAEAYGLRAENFSPYGSLARGGLSNVWGAACFPLTKTELARLPVDAAEMVDSYRAVMRRMGIAGEADEMFGDALGDDMPLLPPVTLSPGMHDIFGRYHGRTEALAGKGFRLAKSWTAILTENREGREACRRCGLCLWGCPARSIWNAAVDLDRLIEHPNFEYRDGLLVTGLDRADPSAQARGWRVKTRSLDGGGDGPVFSAPKIVLAAGTIGSTKLALAAINCVGTPVRLLSNPAFGAAFVLPRRVGGRLGEDGFSMQQLSFVLDPPQSDDDYAFGSLYSGDCLPLAEYAQYMPLARPGGLKLASALAPALVLASCFLSGRHSRNFVTLNGDHSLSISGGHEPDTPKLAASLRRRLGYAMRGLGAWVLPRGDGLLPPGTDIHYAGTLPMGLFRQGAEEPSTDSAGEVRGAPGLHVADGSILPNLPARNLTLTLMANADRIGRLMAKQ